MFGWASQGLLEVPEKPLVQWVIREGEINNVGWLEIETNFMMVRLDLSLKGWLELVKWMGGRWAL